MDIHDAAKPDVPPSTAPMTGEETARRHIRNVMWNLELPRRIRCDVAGLDLLLAARDMTLSDLETNRDVMHVFATGITLGSSLGSSHYGGMVNPNDVPAEFRTAWQEIFSVFRDVGRTDVDPTAANGALQRLKMGLSRQSLDPSVAGFNQPEPGGLSF